MSAAIIYTPEHPAAQHLSQVDPVMRDIIAGVGEVTITPSNDYFATLVDSIVQQMISMRAAATIYGRLVEKAGGAVTPESILALDEDELRGVGLSGRKASYIRSLALAVASGELELSTFNDLPDEEVARQLVSLPGIGQWTVEMFLIFSLGREDVFSPGDGGLTRALKEHYDVDSCDKEAVAELKKRWSPYASVASLYLWKTLGNE